MTTSTQSHILSGQQGLKSRLLSLSNACFLIWCIHIKHVLLAALSNLEMNTCFNNQVSSLYNALSEKKKNDLEYLNPNRLTFKADSYLSLDITLTILDVLSTSRYSFAFKS